MSLSMSASDYGKRSGNIRFVVQWLMPAELHSWCADSLERLQRFDASRPPRPGMDFVNCRIDGQPYDPGVFVQAGY